MNTQTYPGKGLSLSQLIFALNQELKIAVYSPSYVAKDYRCQRSADFDYSFTLDEVSQLDRDTSVALANVREWRNSFIPVNCIPLDVLSLIPTHLASQADRLRASFVCRHWRRTFLHRADLWSEVFLSKGKSYVNTLLERAKGFSLDVIIDTPASEDTLIPLSPYIKQIRCLDFVHARWSDVSWFNPGLFSLLHTLTINIVEEGDIGSFDNTLSSPPLFSNAVNLQVFHFHPKAEWSPFLSDFVFPNLVSFDFSAAPTGGFHASQLLDFLESSPALQTVHVEITARISLDDVPQGRIVVLPNVEKFGLLVTHGKHGYKIAAHISCPSASYTMLTHKKVIGGMTSEEMLPAPAVWAAIVRQYTKCPVEEVTLEMGDPKIECKLSFLSPDGTVIELGLKVILNEENEDVLSYSSVVMHAVASIQATRAIRLHPQVANIKRLRIRNSIRSLCLPHFSHAANEVGRLFKSLGPLEELTFYNCDLRPYLHPFLNQSGEYIEEPIVFPPIKELTISQPIFFSYEECLAIVELSKSRHALGIPFELMTIRKGSVPAEVEERLISWVGSVEYCDDELHDTDDYQGPL